MRILVIIASCLAMISCGKDASAPRAEALRILFVGNSLTYVGNLPAVFDTLSEANGLATASDMIVTGGATLTERVDDGTVAAALAAGNYSFVVLQERGGDFTCGFGPEVCVDARASLATLTRMVRDRGAVPILLGTYQLQAEASTGIEAAESLAAWEVGVDYVAVSERFNALRSKRPSMTWFASDGMHPGPDLTLLYAGLLFERIHGLNPKSAALVVSAPIYTFTSPLAPELRAAGAPTEELHIPSSAHYESERVVAVLENLKGLVGNSPAPESLEIAVEQ